MLRRSTEYKVKMDNQPIGKSTGKIGPYKNETKVTLRIKAYLKWTRKVGPSYMAWKPNRVDCRVLVQSLGQNFL